MSTTFTVFGLQRSGTNFTEQLIQRNFVNVKIECSWRTPNGIWKHAYNIENKDPKNSALGMKGDPQKAKQIGSTIRSVYIHKHPYSWIQSIHRKNVDIAKTYPWVAENPKESRYSLGTLNLLKLIQLYNEHTKYWLNKAKTKKIFKIRYEDLIQSEDVTRKTVQEMSKFFSIKLSKNNIEIPNRVSQSKPFTEKDRQRYKEISKDGLSKDQISIIQENIDTSLISSLGYELL